MPTFGERLDDFLVRYLGYSNYRDYINSLNLKGNKKVLEVGCGGGNLSRFLAKKLFTGRLICIDDSNYWIGVAKSRLKDFRNIKLKLLDILNLNERGFDIIIIHFVLHDIPKEKRNKLLNVLRVRLKKGGLIFIREPTRKNHGISSKEIDYLMKQGKFSKLSSKERYSFPLRSKIYEAVFQKD